ncbi:MAG TPA: MotA/TolQ/ExbB proton channel family protein [Ruminiclostridium sp.]|nr:MotA/TolQ/ExbB proton channel family protein [Ruminiclostridium sp.]
MNILFFIGLIIAFGGILLGFNQEGGNFMSLITHVSPLLIVFGGTFGIALIAFPFRNIKRIPGALKLIILPKKHNYTALVDMLCDIANKARRDGLLSLEAEADKMSDSFIKKGLGYIADGVDPEFLRKVLYNEIESNYKKYEDAAKVFESMGGTAPTMGVLGTVMAMVTVLSGGTDNTSKLVKDISTAFLATLFGIGSANLLWLPIGSQIKVVAGQESDYREVIVEGLMAIQAGEPSSRLKDRLYAKIGDIKSGTAKSSTSASNE